MDRTRLDEAVDTLESELRLHQRAEEILAKALPPLANRYLRPPPSIVNGWTEVRDDPAERDARLNVVRAEVEFRDEPSPHFFIALHTYKGVLGLVDNVVHFVITEAEVDASLTSKMAWKKYVEALASRMADALKATYAVARGSDWSRFAEGWADPVTDAEILRLQKETMSATG